MADDVPPSPRGYSSEGSQPGKPTELDRVEHPGCQTDCFPVTSMMDTACLLVHPEWTVYDPVGGARTGHTMTEAPAAA